MEENKIKISLTTMIIIIILGILCVTGIAILILRHKDNPINIISENNTNMNISGVEDTEMQPEDIKQADGVTIVPTMLDTITSDSSWCGTFQLVWNDMKNELVKQDIVFNPQIKMVENLNKEEFTEEMLSDKYYYKIYDYMSLELKEKIENGIKQKFNQDSDILDDFDWTSKFDDSRYFFYTMLYKKFEFLQEFDKLENDKFGNKFKDVEYFGIDKNTTDSVGNQITVLYYNSQDDFALLINTKTNDEVIFCKKPKGSNFNEIYENMNNQANKYTGSKVFKNIDEFKAPILNINEKNEYKELENKPFIFANGESAFIEKAIQTIKFSLNKKGGEIKSEAGIALTKSVGPTNQNSQDDKPRYFYVDDTFTMFLREKGKTKPYFAGRFDDIKKFQ